jgi:hypothetical protein
MRCYRPNFRRESSSRGRPADAVPYRVGSLGSLGDLGVAWTVPCHGEGWKGARVCVRGGTGGRARFGISRRFRSFIILARMKGGRARKKFNLH